MPLRVRLSLLFIALLIFLTNITSLPKYIRGYGIKALSGITSPINLTYNRLLFDLSSYTKTKEVLKENQQLRNRINELEKRVLVVTEKQESEELKKELIQLSGYEENKLVSAYPTGFYSFKGVNYMTLNKGSKSGVQVGDNVVVGRQLIGLVKYLTVTTSTVRLVDSDNTQVPVKILGSDVFGIVSCKGRVCSLNKVLISKSLNVGDIVITSDKKGEYLPSLLIGAVTSVKSDPSQVFKSGIVEYSFTPGETNQVIIISKK